MRNEGRAMVKGKGYGMINEDERAYRLFLIRVLNVPFIHARHARHALTSISSSTEAAWIGCHAQGSSLATTLEIVMKVETG